MKHLLSLVIVLILSVTSLSAQTDWTYVVTRDSLPVYTTGGCHAGSLEKGKEIWISSFHDDFPVPGSPGQTRRVAVYTEDMEDYVIYLDDPDVIVPRAEYRYERIFSGLGSIVNRDGTKTMGALAIGLLYVVMIFFAGTGVRHSDGGAGWVFFGIFVAVLAGESYYLMTNANPFWFLNFSESGLLKGLLFLAVSIGLLYVKYIVTVAALGQFKHTQLLEDSEFNIERALQVTAVGTWLILSMVYWKSELAVYAMWALGAATVAGVVYVMRKAFRQAGIPLSLCILILILLGGATLCYIACEILAKIIQIIVVCYVAYMLFAGLSKSSGSSGTASDHTVYVDYDGNAHDLYRQSDGTYVDYNDNSRWNRVSGSGKDRFDRIF